MKERSKLTAPMRSGGINRRTKLIGFSVIE